MTVTVSYLVMYAPEQLRPKYPDDPRLHEFIDFDRFPKQLAWVRQARADLLRHASS